MGILCMYVFLLICVKIYMYFHIAHYVSQDKILYTGKWYTQINHRVNPYRVTIT